jgi:Flp pilus assembly protein TadD
VVIGNLYAGHDERVRAYDDAAAAARTATTLAPQFAEGFSALGFALASGKLDMRGARVPFDRSHALAPGDADVLSRYATFRSNLRDHDLATGVILRAVALDPLNARTFRSQGDIRHNAGDHAAAIVAYRKAIELNPTLAGVNASMGFAQLLAGANDEARASFQKERSAVRRLPGLAILAHRAGDKARPRRRSPNWWPNTATRATTSTRRCMPNGATSTRRWPRCRRPGTCATAA